MQEKIFEKIRHVTRSKRVGACPKSKRERALQFEIGMQTSEK